MAAHAQFRFDDAVVIVTGGARGIGRGIVETFLEAGAHVVTCGRNAPEQPLQAAGRQATFVTCDVRDAGAVAQFVDDVIARHGRVDVLVNNAGGAPHADAATSSPRLAEKIVQLNLLAPFHCAQAVNRVMQQQETGGSIINIASISALRPSPGTAVYGAAKAGLNALTRGLALEWAPKVRVNSIVVGLAATAEGLAHYGDAETAARISAMLPMQRMALPSDIAAACCYLASPASSYVSGAQLAVHGAGEPPLFHHMAQQSRESHAPAAR